MSQTTDNKSPSVSEKLDPEDSVDPQEHIITLQDVLMKYDKPWWRIPHLFKLNLCVFAIALTSTNNGYDGSMLNGLQSLDDWKSAMGRPKGAILGALSNGTIFGSLIALPFASFINDRYGRKWGIFLGEALTLLGSILQGASGSYAFFIVSRMILGLGFGIAVVGAAPLISEISYPTHRPICTSMYNTLWYLGAVIAAGVTYGTKDVKHHYSWKIPSYLQGFFPLVQILAIYFLPESPRYLISRGRHVDARNVISKWHVGDDQSVEAQGLVDFEINEIETALEMEKIQDTSRYIDFVKTPGNRKRLFILFFLPVMMQLSGNGLVSYYLNLVLNSIGITGTEQQLKINVALMCFNYVCSVAAAVSTYRFKRRHMFLLSISMMCGCYVIWTILSAVNQQRNFENKSLGQGVLAMIFFFYLSYDIGMNGLPFLYSTEVLSFSLRAKGLNLKNMFQTIIIIYNGFVNAIAMEAIQWKYYIVYCCILACEIPVVYFTFPETSGYTLEEVGAIFGDDPNDVNHVVSVVISGKRSVVSHIEHV